MVTSNGREPKPKLVIFDLCDTLYDVNTTVGFVDYYQSVQHDQRIARILRRWLSKTSLWFYLGAVAQRFLGWDLARQRIVAALASESRATLTKAAADYACNVLPSRANQPLHDQLRTHLAAGDHVMILSSSLDLVVAEVASVLGVDFRASKLGFDGDRCTGQLEQDLTGRKASEVRDLVETSSYICVYTDNRSDRDLIAIANQATIVIAQGDPDDRWGGSGCDYIRL